ncbi:MAG: leucine-rich repeat protein [Bacteroidaceae bacterium]|nr:leucine-rich repeat protein [Bacteroidaceae bacterium]
MKSIRLNLILLLTLLFIGGGSQLAVAQTVTGNCGANGDNLTWSFDSSTGILTISGTGAMADYTTSATGPWNSQKDNIKCVIIGEGVTTIGNCAFYNYTNLKDVIFKGSECPTFNLYKGSMWMQYYPFELCNLTIHYPIGGQKYSTDGNCKYLNTSTTFAFEEAHPLDGLSYWVLNDGTYVLNNSGNLIITKQISTSSTYWTVIGNTLYILGTGAMPDYSLYPNVAPWLSQSNQIESIIIGEGITNIGKYAFWTCSSPTSITIPSTVTSIGEYAFWGCSRLTSITIPASVRTIGKYAFQNCSSLERINFGSLDITFSYAEDGDYERHYPFKGCSALEIINVPNLNMFSKKGFAPSSANDVGTLLGTGNEAKTLLINGTAPAGGKVTISSSSYNSCLKYFSNVTEIEFESGTTVLYNKNFENNPYLEKVTIPSTVTSISEDAFKGCTALVSVTMPTSLTSISESAFEGCIALTSTTIPENVESVGKYAFKGCTALEAITIPSSVTSVGESAFEGCTGLTDATLNGGGEIGVYAFKDCNKLEKVNIGSGVTVFDFTIERSVIGTSECNIRYYPFYRCSALKTINVTDLKAFMKIPREDLMGSDLISYGTLINPLFSEEMTLQINGVEQDEVTIPEDVTYNGCLKYFSNVTKVVIPENMTTVSGFKKHTYLTEVTFKGDCSIDGEAFWYCRSLARVNLGSGVKFLLTRDNDKNNYPFVGCSALETINVTSLSGFMSNKDGLAPSLSNDVGTLLGTGKEAKTLLINGERPADGKVTIPASSSTYGGFFKYFSNVTEVEIPSSMTTVAGFKEHKYLKKVTLPSTVTSIADNAFKGCTALEEITIPENVTSVGESAFEGCTDLTEVTFNGGGTIGGLAFGDCTSLAKVNIVGSAVTTCNYLYHAINGENYEYYPFVGCSELGTINVTDLAAFMKIQGLTSSNSHEGTLLETGNQAKSLLINNAAPIEGILSIPNGVTEIPFHMFYCFTNFNAVIIPASVDTINDYVFGANVTTVFCQASTPPTYVAPIFTYTSDPINRTLIVPIGSAETYRNNKYGNYFGTIIERASIITLNHSELNVGYDAETTQLAVNSTHFTASSWTSSNPSVATVDENGVVTITAKPYDGTTAYSAPTAVITATISDGMGEASCTVVVTTEEAELADGNQYVNTDDLEFSKITYTRSYPVGRYSAIYLPFDVPYDVWGDKFSVARPNNVYQHDNDDDGFYEDTSVEFIILGENSTMKANSQYIIKPKNVDETAVEDGKIEIPIVVNSQEAAPAILYAAAETTIDCASVDRYYTFTGIYSETTLTGDDKYAFNQGKLNYAQQTGTVLSPYRWYMTVANRDGSEFHGIDYSVKIHVIGDDYEEDDSELTGIEEVISVPNEGELKVFSVDGRNMKTVRSINELQTVGLPSGIYIVNGKKYVVK